MVKKHFKLISYSVLVSCLLLIISSVKAAEVQKITAEDALIVALYPRINQEVHQYYKEYIIDGPTVAPYAIEIVDLYRKPNKLGDYEYTIILETRPYLGAHMDVGLDRITFVLALEGVKSVRFEHLESSTIPPWLQDHIIKPLP